MRWLVALLALGGFSCTEPPIPGPFSQRLVDVFEPEWLEGSVEEPTAKPMPTEWRFDGPPPEPAPALAPATRGWQPFTGIAGLTVSGGRLIGRTTSDLPVLRLVRTSGLDDGDPLVEIRVRMKTSAGGFMSVHLAGSEENVFDDAIAAGTGIWFNTAPLVVGDELRTYTFTTPWAVRSADIHQIFLRPSDRPGASFEVESVRLVFRRELLAEKPSGIGWEGLSDIYRETVIARVPESIRWPLTLPERPRLELALGTLDARPVTFRISVDPGGGAAEIELASRTLTTVTRWEELALDLDELAGREITLHLALEAEAAGTVGLWGSPVVRDWIEPRTTSKAWGGSTPPKRLAWVPPDRVIFILADTLRADHLESYGYGRPTMPELSRLVREGTLFRDSLAQGSWTKVSAASLFTSLYPNTNCVREFADRVPSSATTLAEVYRQAGYATLGFSSVLYTGKFSNLHQGYEVLHESVSLGGRSKTARTFVDRLLPWLEDHRQQRFFVFLHVFDPHPPLEPDPPYDALWIGASGSREHRRELQELQAHIADPIRRILKAPTREEVLAAGRDPTAFIERELAWYDGSIRGMDQELGRLFERLRELGLDDRTLIVLTSDHGEEFHDHGRMSHSHSVYGELTQVPLVLWYPGVVPAGAVIEETVQLLDLMPTLLDLSGLPSPDGLQGQSLLPLLAAAGSEALAAQGRWHPRPAISERPPVPGPSIPPLPAAESTALVYEGWKLIRHLEPLPGVDEFELYDHRGDPYDQINLAAEHPEVVERLARLMSAWRRQTLAERLAPGESVDGNLSQEELDRLRALGYLSDNSVDAGSGCADPWSSPVSFAPLRGDARPE